MMNQYITDSGYFFPWNLRILLSEFIRNIFYRFSHDFQSSDTGINNHFILVKSFKFAHSNTTSSKIRLPIQGFNALFITKSTLILRISDNSSRKPTKSNKVGTSSKSTRMSTSLFFTLSVFHIRAENSDFSDFISFNEIRSMNRQIVFNVLNCFQSKFPFISDFSSFNPS